MQATFSCEISSQVIFLLFLSSFDSGEISPIFPFRWALQTGLDSKNETKCAFQEQSVRFLKTNHFLACLSIHFALEFLSW